MALSFARDLPFGRCVGIALPRDDEAARLDALADSLPAGERAHAATLRPARRATWVGGRVALRAALGDLGLEAGPILSTARGAPALPPGIAGSVSHKESVAVALAARADGATLGVDVEIDRPSKTDIASRVLTDGEQLRLAETLPAAARARVVLVAFSAKEAIYKALDPWVRRHVSFLEVEIARARDGRLTATLAPRAGEGPFSVELHEEPLPGLILVAARVRLL
jgi:4'-phosphopantetheinyl transferase EntD